MRRGDVRDELFHASRKDSGDYLYGSQWTTESAECSVIVSEGWKDSGVLLQTESNEVFFCWECVGNAASK